MSLARVLTRGQVTLPKDVRRAAGIQPGDLIAFTVSEPGRVELRVLPHMTLAETFERYHIEEPIDWDNFTEGWQDIAARDVFGKA